MGARAALDVGGIANAAASLLGGYALENLLKGLRVKQLRGAGESIMVKGQLRRELTRHDLIALAKAAGVPLARHERFLLERLTVTITWGGRYIAPKDVGETDSATMISTDQEAIRLFAAKLDDMFEGKEPVDYDKLLNAAARPLHDHKEALPLIRPIVGAHSFRAAS